ncbi:cytochrome c [Acidiphilium sp. AL]|uniref:Cytochrome c n=1 Tax=Acidiphilium iwatense TaxID=768198 RepID=A0ABS9DTN8_9PROT|nr:MULTISPECIES: c-type cytochrome [Acidiphilium]MCF3946095.1 cytochrome c [Acidiphilium iwatense]MCU4160965.1 cytochrome c [Acidiphilium sp. AL]
MNDRHPSTPYYAVSRRGNFRPATFAGALILSLGLTGLAAAACAPSSGDYTAQQAAAGKSVYDAHCAACHASNLSGASGPALAGGSFASYLQFTKMTAGQLFDYMSAHMPANAPGSLSKPDYLNVLAYILQVNHYPAGKTPLSAKSAACTPMVPYPGSH